MISQLQFLEICLPQSGRCFELNGRHKMYNDVSEYFEHFWCLFEGEAMIGTAALKKLDSDKCELKSLYLLEQYHKKDWDGHAEYSDSRGKAKRIRGNVS